jgi:hypothetical protein
MIQDDGDTRPMTIYQPEEPTLWDTRDVASYLKASPAQEGPSPTPRGHWRF